MGILDRLAGLFGFARKTDEPMARRRWDSAKTTRLNEGHWTEVTSNPQINADLESYLETLRDRSSFELANNPFIAGCVETHAISVVGANGPTTQIQSDSPLFNEWLEGWWAQWWAEPDINGVMSGPDFIRGWVRSEWWAGEDLTQITNDPSATTPLQLRIHALNPRRLLTPPREHGDASIALGIKRTNTGKPLTYYIQESSEGTLLDLRQVWVPHDAKDIIHGFTMIEPGQARGIPLLANCLDDIACLRDCDEQVLDAVRAAADFAAILTTKHPDAKYIAVQEQADVERRTLTTAPPGWEVTQLKPEQPATNYVEYRHEKLRAIGRVAGLPLQMILLDSSGHNYSSARFDGKLFDRANEIRQRRYERPLMRLIRLVEREARLVDPLAPAAPPFWTAVHTWESPPHVDPVKESAAEAQLLANGTITYAHACSTHGNDWESVVEQRAREQQTLEAAGLPIPWASPAPEPEPEEPEEPEVPEEEDRTLEDFDAVLRRGSW
jgi:lambda family phage portal protein